MHYFQKSTSLPLLFTFFLTLFFSSADAGNCQKKCHNQKKKCHEQIFYYDNFALPITEDPLEPLAQAFQASNWVTPPFFKGIEFGQNSYSRGNGVYTLFNKGAPPEVVQITGNYKTLTNSFALEKGATYRFKAEISLTLDITNIPPAWIPHLVPGGINVDPRPADCGYIVTFIEPQQNETVLNTVNGCFFFAKNAVWTYFDMAVVDQNFSPVGNYPFFSHARLGAEIDTSQKHIYEIEFHRSHIPANSYIKWFVDGKEVRKQGNFGFIPQLEKNDLFNLLSFNGPCEQLLQTTLDPTLAQVTIETGQQGHSAQAIVGSPGEQGLAPSFSQFGGPICFPTSFVTPTPQLLNVNSSLSIYHLLVKSISK